MKSDYDLNDPIRYMSIIIHYHSYILIHIFDNYYIYYSLNDYGLYLFILSILDRHDAYRSIRNYNNAYPKTELVLVQIYLMDNFG